MLTKHKEKQTKKKMGHGSEALVVCSDRSLKIGITIWDINTGDQILHIPTCAASPHGFLCLRNQYFVASQANIHGSLAGGTIFMWAFNKPQSPLRSYTMEAMGPISCTKNGVYLAGGASSGYAYIWEVISGRLLKMWCAHYKSLKCMAFSDDGSLLISGSDDGMICVWSMISLLDMEDSGGSLLHYSSEHKSSITGLLTISCGASWVFISSSLDGTCKVWDLISGRLIQTLVYPQAITAIVVLPEDHQLLFSGCVDGRIFINKIEIGLVENPFVVAEDQSVQLKGHNGSITALTFSASGLISASEDRSVCLWDVATRVIIRRFDHQKGPVTNLVVIPKSSSSDHQRVSNQFRVSLLDKYPQPAELSKVTCFSSKDDDVNLSGTKSQYQHMIKLQCEQQEGTPAAMQMKVETNRDYRTLAAQMAKHVMEINKHLQCRRLDLTQHRLLWPRASDSTTTAKNQKKLKIQSPSQEQT